MVVRASGTAKDDQSLYLGNYRQIANYNGHAAYELEGQDQLYIYYYSSVVSKKFENSGKFCAAAYACEKFSVLSIFSVISYSMNWFHGIFDE